MFKRLFKSFIFISAFLVCGHTYGSDYDHFQHYLATGRPNIHKNKAKESSYMADIAHAIYLISLFAIIIIISILNKSDNNFSKFILRRHGWKTSHNGSPLDDAILNFMEDKIFGGHTAQSSMPTGVITDNTKEIIAAMYDENLGLDNEKFAEHVKEVFKTLKKAYSQRDIKLLPFMTDKQYLEHRNKIRLYIEEEQINITDIKGFDRIYLYKYNKTMEYDYLAVFLEARTTNYVIDEHTGVALRGSRDIEKLIKHLLVFRRDRKVLETTIKDTPTALVCPKCGAPALISNIGRCVYCSAVIKEGSYQWALAGIGVIFQDSRYGPGGVFINNVQTGRYKNGIN